MNELDFDELDKAVNSLMQTKAPSDTSIATTDETSPVEPVVDLDTSPAVDAPRPETVVDSTAPADSTASSDTTGEQPSLATKRRGQFMDVMHPSANMVGKEAQTIKVPPRTAATLQPVNQLSGLSEATGSASTAGAIVGNDITPVSGKQAEEWPDPLDMMQQQEDRLKQDAEPKPPLSIVPGEPIADSEKEPATFKNSETMDSPFLPDAKVEKRPLGIVESPESDVTAEPSPASAETIDEAQEDSTAPSIDVATNIQSEPSVIDTAQSDSAELPDLSSEASIPAELQEPIMSVESHDTSPDSTEPVVSEQPVAEPTQDEVSAANTPEVPQAEVSLEVEVPTTATADATAVPALTVALPPRQPQSPPVDDDEAKTSIFDNDHPSVKHPEKHSSGWFAVVIIGAMLIIGAIGGAIVYLQTNGY